MALVVTRSETVQAVVTRLQERVPEFHLVKPFEGELGLDPNSSRERWTTGFRGRFPCALVVSRLREDRGSVNRLLRFTHHLTVLVGTADFKGRQGTEMPAVYELLDGVIDALAGFCPVRGKTGVMRFGKEEPLARTDRFTLYASYWAVPEQGR